MLSARRFLPPLLAAFVGGCASGGSIEARHRSGSLMHAFGAPLVISGLAGGVTTAVEAGEGARSEIIAVTGIGSAVFLGVGVALLVAGSAEFVELDADRSSKRSRPSPWGQWGDKDESRSSGPRGATWDPKLGIWVRGAKTSSTSR